MHKESDKIKKYITDIKEMFGKIDDFEKNNVDLNNVEKLLCFFFNDFYYYLINEIVNNNNYKNSLTTNEKNIIIDFITNNYANDLFFQNILDYEIYNNLYCDNLINVDKKILLEKNDKNNYLTNKIIELKDYFINNNDKSFTKNYIEIFQYLDSNNLHSHFLKIKNKF